MPLNGKVYQDKEGQRLETLFVRENARYIIRYNYTFSDTLIIPNNSEIYFKGGSLSGPIVFQNTRLRGDVNLKGSYITGRLKNKVFEATWLCSADGISDDAAYINNIISICDCIHFKKGVYRLKSRFKPSLDIDSYFYPDIESHIGIHRSGIIIKGDKGAELITDMPVGTICIYSLPGQIEKSVSNIEINGISFTVQNNGHEFHEYMHTIKTIGVNNLLVRNCIFNDFWGDAICLSHYGDNPQTGERTRNENVMILNNQIVGGSHHNNRNGISVISGKNVLIKRNVIKETSRKDMPGGIDVEPNNSAYTIDNIRILDNVLDNIRGGGGAIGLCTFNNGPASNIYIERNRISRSIKGIQLNIKTENITYNIYIRNNIVSDDTKPYNFMGKGKIRNLVVTDNLFGKAISQEIPGDLVVNKLTVKRNIKKKQGS